jgi:hypothetical protein
MFRIDPRPLLALTAVAALLAVAGPAQASSANPPSGIVTDNKDPDKLAFSGDAYVNEMGIAAHSKPSADGIIAVLTGLNHTDRGSGVAADGGAITGVA